MAGLRVIICFAVSLCVASIVVRGDDVPIRKITLSDKSDATGYHKICSASKTGYKGGWTWEHSFDHCGIQNAHYCSLIEDKYTKIANAENDDEILSTLTLVGATGKEEGQKHCVCCRIETSNSLCFNLTMTHEHDHAHHDHHAHHNHHHH